MQNTVHLLKSAGISPTKQRILIYDYFKEKDHHPSVEEVYQALKPKLKHLSKTTVYNTLYLFAENHLVRELSIDPIETRFDGIMTRHAHFQCENCGAIYNVGLPFTFEHLLKDGFETTDFELNIRGRCPYCRLEEA